MERLSYYDYIISFEDGENFVASEITEQDIKALDNGIITIIRLSDLTILGQDHEWHDMKEWNSNNEI